MDQRDGIKEGMIVRSADGHRLGKVYAVGESEFHIEKGLFFPKDYSVRYAEVSDLVDGEIILSHGKQSLRPFSSDELYNIDPLDSGRAPVATRPVERDVTWRSEQEYENLPLDRRIEGLRTDDLGDQSIGTHNTEGARASPLLTEEDRARAIERPMPRTLPQEPGIGLLLRHEPVRPTMRASSDLDEPVGVTSPERDDPAPLHTADEAREAGLVEDELYEGARRPRVRGDAQEDTPRRWDFSGESAPKKRGF